MMPANLENGKKHEGITILASVETIPGQFEIDKKIRQYRSLSNLCNEEDGFF